jgi:hypothetical protein
MAGTLPRVPATRVGRTSGSTSTWEISGQQASETGSSSIVLPHGSTDKGKYVVVYKRVAGGSKIAYDIFNSDSAPPK